ncbi:MAG TPA: PTS sugar transporter subunit IIA [Chthoniobacterales bacterium]|jgi:mannitol/fructose-specific phosphotransferase system IIA component (Ntr-type)|nr:PTS sugar transporter subunit IIA [Chthoniobacterales bacterium]
MIRIRGTLLAENVLLDLDVKSRAEAVQRVTESLRGDFRISNWQEFLRALRAREAVGKANLEHGLTLPHVRTSAVTKMLMAFGRTTEPIQDENVPIQFVVLVGIPETMDSDYLRLVGTLMRVLREDALRQKLLYAQDSAEILQVFERGG